MQNDIHAESGEAPTKVLLVDDHALVAEAISVALARTVSIAFDIASTTQDALNLISQNGSYDVILVDYDLPGERGLDGLEKLIAANKKNVALFSGVAGPGVVERALAMGASGFVPKTLPLKTLKHAINFIADGEIFVPASLAASPFSSPAGELGLKPREAQVLNFLGEGMPNKEIGLRMGMPESIIKLDVKAICRKLGVKNRTQAVIEARRLRLV